MERLALTGSAYDGDLGGHGVKRTQRGRSSTMTFKVRCALTAELLPSMLFEYKSTSDTEITANFLRPSTPRTQFHCPGFSPSI